MIRDLIALIFFIVYGLFNLLWAILAGGGVLVAVVVAMLILAIWGAIDWIRGY
jgi:hypothetical protein